MFLIQALKEVPDGTEFRHKKTWYYKYRGENNSIMGFDEQVSKCSIEFDDPQLFVGVAIEDPPF